MASDRNIIKSTAEYTRSYENLRGVDFSEHSRDTKTRFSYLENMYVDYDGGGCVQSIPGFRKICSLDGKINRIFPWRRNGYEYIVVHAGTNLYSFKADDRDSVEEIESIYGNMSDRRSCAFSFGESLYILNTNKIVEIDKDENVTEITGSHTKVYVPTTHIDGVGFEPRNLLTNRFKQLFTVRSTDELAFATDGLTYAILDYDSGLCAVSGSRDGVSGELHIPSYTSIGGKRYKVTEILDYAFENETGITSLVTNGNLEKIGHRAFAGCTSLTSVYLSKTVKSIGTFSFDQCSSLSYFYIGEGFKLFGSTPFNLCTSLKEIHYAKSSDDFESVENISAFEDRDVYYNVPYKAVKLSVELLGNVFEISDVTVDGISIQYEFIRERQIILIDCENKELIHGHSLMISGCFSDDGDGFLATDLGKRLYGEESILGCKMACSFDGRIFLSGNPALPGVVFYSGTGSDTDSPLYFSTDNYIIDGTADYPVASILPVGEKLLVFKSGDDGAGSIFYHAPLSQGKSRTYPTSYIRNGITLCGDSSVFMGDGIFVSSEGVCAAINGSSETPNISCRSKNISKRLSTEAVSDIRLAEWCGYLVVSSGGRMYLADSKDKYTEDGTMLYEWYFLNGIGTYRNDERVYRYLSRPNSFAFVHQNPDTVVNETVYSIPLNGGGFDYYTSEPMGNFAVYPTEEYRGGTFYPATELCSMGNLLFFGTDCGDLCVFNNDKRGVPPPYIASDDGFDPYEYSKKMGSIIHPYYYSFGNHSVKYMLVTASDDCGVPYLEKSTVRASLSVKFKCMSDSEISVLVKTDRGTIKELSKINTGVLDFYGTDFSHLALDSAAYRTLTINEKERGWIEKQFIFTSDGFRTPMGIHSLAYRYKIKGKIRNK